VRPTHPVDPFDLPDWLGTTEVTWTAATALDERSAVTGELSAGEQVLGCDLLAVDQAFPEPVVAEEWRRQAHERWTRGEVLLLQVGERLTLAVPGTCFDADRVLGAVGRLARSIGVRPERFLAALRPRSR
jgi:hypothetical protein